jgi:hypothetical protein
MNLGLTHTSKSAKQQRKDESTGVHFSDKPLVPVQGGETGASRLAWASPGVVALPATSPLAAVRRAEC